MRLILDAVRTAGPDRAAIAAHARATHERESQIGCYSLDSDGLTTSPDYALRRIAGGAFVTERISRAR